MDKRKKDELARREPSPPPMPYTQREMSQLQKESSSKREAKLLEEQRIQGRSMDAKRVKTEFSSEAIGHIAAHTVDVYSRLTDYVEEVIEPRQNDAPKARSLGAFADAIMLETGQDLKVTRRVGTTAIQREVAREVYQEPEPERSILQGTLDRILGRHQG